MLLKNTYVSLGNVQVSNDEFTDFFTNCQNIVKNLIALDKVLVGEEEYVSNGGILPEDVALEDIQLDVIEEFVNYAVPESVPAVILKSCFKNGAIRLRFNAGFSLYKDVYSACERYTDMFIVLTAEQVNSLKETVKNSLSELLYGLFYQYDLDETFTSVCDDTEGVNVNVSVNSFCASLSVKPESLAVQMKDLLNVYKVSLDIFDEYPEYEEAFYDAVGAYASDFEALESLITVELVKEIINGLEVNDAFFDELKAGVRNASVSK